MKAGEWSRRFSDSKKRLAPGEDWQKLSRRRAVVCEKLSRRLQEFGKNNLASKVLNMVPACFSESQLVRCSITLRQQLNPLSLPCSPIDINGTPVLIVKFPAYNLQTEKMDY